MQISSFISDKYYHLRVFLSEQLRLAQSESADTPSEIIDPSQEPENREGAWKDRIAIIRSILRKNPLWYEGHLRLAGVSLKIDDVATAYASLNACRMLKSEQEPEAEVTRLFGVCYLRRGSAEKARQYFELCLDELKNDPEFVEDYAAALMALGECNKALEYMGKTPRDKLSLSAQAILEAENMRGK